MHHHSELKARTVRLAALVLLAHLGLITAFLFHSPLQQPSQGPEIVIPLRVQPMLGQVGNSSTTPVAPARASRPLSSPQTPRPLTSIEQSGISNTVEPLTSLPVDQVPSPAAPLASEQTQGKPQEKLQAKPLGQDGKFSEKTEPNFQAAYLNNPKPPYPRMAVRQQIEGTVTLLVRVLPDGRAAEVRVDQSSGNSLLDHSALTTVQSWRFVPARQAGVAVTAEVRVPIVFSLHSN